MKFYQRRVTVWLLAGAMAVVLVLTGCSSPEVRKQKAYERGRALLESGETKKALLEFRNAVQIDPKFTDARYYLGVCLVKEDNYEAALGELKRVEEAQPDRADLKPYMAEALVGAGEFAKGRELFVALCNESPGNAHFHDLLSRAALGLSQPGSGQAGTDSGVRAEDYRKEAVAEAEKALALDPKLIEPHMTLAQALILTQVSLASAAPVGDEGVKELEKRFGFAKENSPNDVALSRRIAGLWVYAGHRSRALGELEMLLTAAPTDTEARLMKAELLLEDGKVEEAEGLSAKLAEEKVSHPRLDFLKGRIWFSKGEFEKARDEFRKVRDNAAGGYFLACCLDKLGDRQSAISQFQQVLDQAPTHEGARRALFEMSMNDGNLARASLQAEQAVKADAQSSVGYVLRARVYSAQTDWSRAHLALDDALRCAPGLVEALLLRADVYRKEGDLEKSKAALDEVVQVQPGAAIGYLVRSEVLLGQKKFAEAEADALRAAQLAPKDPLPHMTIARSRVAQGDLGGGAAAYEKALALAPGNAEPRLALAALYAARKEYDKAMPLLQAITEKNASYVPARTRIAELYDAMGKPDAAAAEFKQLLASHPDAADASAGLFRHFSRSADFHEMENLAKATLERDPDSALGHLMLSDLYSARGLWVQAAEQINVALKKLPGSWWLWFRLGVLTSNAGRFTEALEALQRARELQPDFDPATLKTAEILARTGRGDEAVELCGKVLAKTPDDIGANLAMADIKAALGKDAEAETAYKSIIASHPEALAARLRLAALYEKGKQAGGTAKVPGVFEAAIAAAPNVPELHVEYGRFWERTKDRERARQQYARALELSPDNPRILDFLARLSAESGDYAAAEQRLRAQLARAPNDVSARLNLALALEKQGKAEEATQSLFTFITSSKNPEAAGMELSRLFASLGQYDKIERLARSLIEADASNWMAHYALGTARAGQGDAEGARAHFGEAAELNKKLPLAKHAEGLMYAQMNLPDEALAAFEAARRIDARFLPAYTDAALMCLRKKDFDGAEALCRKALEVDPKAVNPALLLAAVYARSKREPMAMQTVYDLLERDPKQAVAASAIADVLGSAGRHDDAIALGKRCLEAAPEAPAILMRLGTAYERAGKRDLAVAEYSRVVNLAPNAALARNNLAWLLAEQNKLDEALPHAQRARDLLPNDPAILDTLGLIHLKKGDLDKAIPLLEAAAKGAAKEPQILYHLGKAYNEAGRMDDARPLLAQALELDANFVDAEDARKMLESMPASPK